jgi:septal ring factor EnvC (AmiA/AmiB activator)
VILLAVAGAAAAEDREPVSAIVPVQPVAAAGPIDPRAQLAAQLAEEQKTIDKTIVTVGDKLADADRVRLERLRAAYRLLRAPLRSTATAAERMAAARRRAAARLLVDRDAAERGLLTEESTHLMSAAARTTADVQKLPTITLPAELASPVVGTVARKFGTLEHERSKAILSRRGIDLEVESRANVTSPADGVVRYAGPIRGLDDGLILDHGDFYTVIAKLADLGVPVGARVHRGDRIGHAARYRVYLEVRVKLGPGGLPIDPEPLFEKPNRKPR